MRMLSLCSGIGMIDYAAEQAGIEIAAQCEIDPFCQQVLSKHYPDVLGIANIEDVIKNADRIGTIDIVAGGIPCQPFSISGKKRGKSDDRYLWPQTFSIVQHFKPTWVFIENVARFSDVALDDVYLHLESEKYEVASFLLPACATGAPHVRERLFIVAYSACKRWNNRQHLGTGGRVSGDEAWNVPKIHKNWQQFQCELREAGTSMGNLYHTQHKEQRPANIADGQQWLPEPRLGGMLDGYSAFLDSYQWPALPQQVQHQWEPPRTIEAPSSDARRRIKAIGNAVVWTVVYPFFWLMRESERNA